MLTGKASKKTLDVFSKSKSSNDVLYSHQCQARHTAKPSHTTIACICVHSIWSAYVGGYIHVYTTTILGSSNMYLHMCLDLRLYPSIDE